MLVKFCVTPIYINPPSFHWNQAKSREKNKKNSLKDHMLIRNTWTNSSVALIPETRQLDLCGINSLTNQSNFARFHIPKPQARIIALIKNARGMLYITGVTHRSTLRPAGAPWSWRRWPEASSILDDGPGLVRGFQVRVPPTGAGSIRLLPDRWARLARGSAPAPEKMPRHTKTTTFRSGLESIPTDLKNESLFAWWQSTGYFVYFENYLFWILRVN